MFSIVTLINLAFINLAIGCLYIRTCVCVRVAGDCFVVDFRSDFRNDELYVCCVCLCLCLCFCVCVYN